jgi:hypothetical protein
MATGAGVSEGAKIKANIKGNEEKADTGVKVGIPNDRTDHNYPGKYFSNTEFDDNLDIKQQFLEKKGWQATVGPEEIASVKQKENAILDMKFEEWFANTYGAKSDNPVMQQWAQQMVPEFFDKRERAIDSAADIQSRLAKIRLRGVKTREDMLLIFGIKQGLIEVPEDVLFQLGKSGNDQAKIVRGLFNPRGRVIVNSSTKFSPGAPLMDLAMSQGRTSGPTNDLIGTGNWRQGIVDFLPGSGK